MYCRHTKTICQHKCDCSQSRLQLSEQHKYVKKNIFKTNDINKLIPEKNASLGEPLKMVVVNPEIDQRLRCNKNITVNPWSSVEVIQIENSLLPAINQPSQPVTHRSEEYNDTQIKVDDDSKKEPIYDEIRQFNKNKKAEESDKCDTEADKFFREDVSENSNGKKNEIIYWQITAKEVAKFQPCTETFIKRL